MFSLERMLKIWAKYSSFYWEGLGKTLIFALLAVLLGLVLGLALACGRMQRASRRQNPVVRGLKGLCRFLCTAYVEVFRATPMLVQIFIIYYGIGSLIKLPETSVNRMFWGMVAVGLNSAAYMSEIIRAGIGAVPPGQMEAARCLGMSHWRAMRRIRSILQERRPAQGMTPRRAVATALLGFGVPTDHMGYCYIQQILLLLVEEGARGYTIDELYHRVCEMYGAPGSGSVEKAIREEVKRIFKAGSPELAQLLHFARRDGVQHLSNGEFLTLIAQAIRLKYML